MEKWCAKLCLTFILILNFISINSVQSISDGWIFDFFLVEKNFYSPFVLDHLLFLINHPMFSKDYYIVRTLDIVFQCLDIAWDNHSAPIRYMHLEYIPEKKNDRFISKFKSLIKYYRILLASSSSVWICNQNSLSQFSAAAAAALPEGATIHCVIIIIMIYILYTYFQLILIISLSNK